MYEILDPDVERLGLLMVLAILTSPGERLPPATVG